MRIRLLLAAVAALAGSTAAVAAATVDVEPYLRRDQFQDIRISPTGEYIAATVPMEDRTGLAIVRRADGERTAAFALGKDTHIGDFVWVNPKRVVFELAVAHGQLDKPQPTGELMGIDADQGRTSKLLANEASGVAGRVGRKVEDASASLIDTLPGNDDQVLIRVRPFGVSAWPRAERVNAVSGQGRRVANAPVPEAWFSADHAGVIRMAAGAGDDNISKLYHRADDSAEWVLINDEQVTGRRESVIGFAADNRTVYLRAYAPGGPDSIVAYDTASGTRETVLRDDDADPYRIIHSFAVPRAPVGAMLMDGRPRTVFFDENSPEAKLYRSLERAFPGQAVLATSSTDDGRLVVFRVFADSSPGDWYIYDRENRRAELLVSSREWLRPDEMAEVEPVSLSARDGLLLRGYVTRPRGATGALPMVLMPHGGPFHVADGWGFDDDAQILAAAGYAVLQVNFRGSGGRGRDFAEAGARQWGRAMQDDLTDATRWAIENGVADAGRICIYGASYGAYAALMGVAREPELYRCAAGYVGVYDLPLMHRQDAHANPASRTWLDQWVGPREGLGAVSPVNLAERIKVPVFLAAGREDRIAPAEHTERMAAALRRAGVAVDTLYYNTEGHGFYDSGRRVEYYSRLLDFLAGHIGGARAAERRQ